MAIIGTFNGASIIALPSDTVPGVQGPSSLEWDKQEVVGENTSPFTGQTQIYDWQTSWLEGQVSFPPMTRYSADAWSSFLSQCRGKANVFLMGDPKAALPKGAALGSPVVSGSGQTGYSLITRGWNANQLSAMLTGDYIQIGYRLYEVTQTFNSDSSGNATLTVWPNLRDAPADAAAIITRQCKGLFRLKNNSGNKRSINPGNYGISGFAIKEAI